MARTIYHPAPLGLMARLILNDVRKILRDGLMIGIVFAPLLIALIFRLFVPPPSDLQAALAPYLDPPATERIAMAAPVLLLSLLVAVSPGLLGAVFGLLLVSERDERTLLALRVMPVSLPRYIATRMFTPLALSIPVTIAAYPLSGLAPGLTAPIVLAAVVGATSAPVVALGMAAFAKSKMAGLAAMRVANSILALPILAYFATPPLVYLAWPSPAYWQMKALWSAAADVPLLVPLSVALIINMALALLFFVCIERQSES